jgi:hypothetical protein
MAAAAAILAVAVIAFGFRTCCEHESENEDMCLGNGAELVHGAPLGG